MRNTKEAGSTRRRYPRLDLKVRARLSLRGDGRRAFEATLPTANISVGGLFLESTFFLKPGVELMVELELPPLPGAERATKGRTVRMRGQVVRVETPGPRGGTRSGFALRFTEYYEGSQVVLASYFLGPVLRRFIEDYARAHRVKTTPEYVAQMVDILAAWELARAEGQGSGPAGLISSADVRLHRQR